MKHSFKLVVVLVFAPILLILLSQKVWANDPWYSDLTGHWVRPFVHTLWQEEVTDGLLLRMVEPCMALYLPDQPVTKAELVVFLSKVFNFEPASPAHPSYPDVPKSYCILRDKPAWGYIEAALQEDIAFNLPGLPFNPDGSLSREEAVEFIVRSLDLKDYADSLLEQEVMSLLNKFFDGNRTSPSHRQSMACAIKLKIIEGYDDGTLKPKSEMLRSHAATVIYRSCTIRARAFPDVFSPDNDGIDEIVKFSMDYLRNRGISTWQFTIEDNQGKAVHRFNTDNAPGYPPPLLTWDGYDGNGKALPADTYHYQAQVKDKNNNVFFSVKKPIKLIRHTLSASLYPTTCTDGDILSINARTTPEAQKVYVCFQDGTVADLMPDATMSKWGFSFHVSPSLPSGYQPVNLAAVFNRAERNKTLHFTRMPLDFISPDIIPNPAEQGQTISLTCLSSQNIIEVTAYLLDAQINLIKNDNLWKADYIIPLDTPPGDYTVTFYGFTGDSQLIQNVTLTVTGSYLANLQFVLVH